MNTIKDITVVQMEVPCCHGMTAIALRAAQAAGSNVPIETVVIERTGGIQPAGATGLRPFPG